MGFLKWALSYWRNHAVEDACLHGDTGPADSKISVQTPHRCSPPSKAEKGHLQGHQASNHPHSPRHWLPDPTEKILNSPVYSEPIEQARFKPLPATPSSFVQRLATSFRKRVASVFDKRPSRNAVQPSPPSGPTHRPITKRNRSGGSSSAPVMQPSSPTHRTTTNRKRSGTGSSTTTMQPPSPSSPTYRTTANRKRSGTGSSAATMQPPSPSSPTHRAAINRKRSGTGSFANTVQLSSPLSLTHRTIANRNRAGTGSSAATAQPPPPPSPSNLSHQATRIRSRSGTHSSAHGPGVSPLFDAVGNNITVPSMPIYNAGRDIIVNSPASLDQQGWKTLVEHSAPSALHTSAALSSLRQCDAGTRVNVFRRISEWARPTQPRILCMTGAAGSGKSAIALTAVAHFEDENSLAAAFFYSSSDNTRNTNTRLVFTIANQLGSLDYRLREAIDEAMKLNPHLITASLIVQARKLILEPFQITGVPVPPIMLFDGVDECEDEEEQDALINLLTDPLWDGTPFRFLVTSRPEVAVHDALKPGGRLNGSYCIRLSDDEEFDATEDIKKSLSAQLQRFNENGTYNLQEAIDIIAAASSGQYVYSATVVQYVSAGRRDSPLERLKGVVKWIRKSPCSDSRPPNPLHALDQLYKKILTSAVQYASNARDDPSIPLNPGPFDKEDEVDPILLVLQAFASLQISTVPPSTSEPAAIHNNLLGLRDGSVTSVVCDLRSLVRERARIEAGPIIQFYHRTCLEFLQDERRAGKDLYYPKTRIDSYLLKRLCGVFTSSAENAVAMIADKEGQFTDDETTWLNCTSASLFGVILRSEKKPKELERALKRFQAKDPGLEKLKDWVLLASRYPQFAEHGLVKTSFAAWRACLSAVQNAKDAELATAAAAVLGLMTGQ